MEEKVIQRFNERATMVLELITKDNGRECRAENGNMVMMTIITIKNDNRDNVSECGTEPVVMTVRRTIYDNRGKELKKGGFEE